MASGKSVLGASIAQKLGLPFYDTDEIIETETGKSINYIFEKFGETKFRELEKACIQNLKIIDDFVLSVGGGLPCFNSLIDDLNDLGMTIFLDVDLEHIFKRVKFNRTNRPILKDLKEEALRDYIIELNNKRHLTYKKAKFSIAIRNDSEEETLEKLVNLIYFHQKDL